MGGMGVWEGWERCGRSRRGPVMMPTDCCAWNTHNDQSEVTEGSKWL